MKLVEILARELQEWPEQAAEARTYGYMVRFYDDECGVLNIKARSVAEDHLTAIVTRHEWETERTRIGAELDKALARRWGETMFMPTAAPAPPFRMDIITESLCGQEQYRTPCTVIGEYEGRMVVVEDDANQPRFVDRERLHPHMTPEQLAANEREDAVEDMWSAAHGKASSAALELLYDAGYRRQ